MENPTQREIDEIRAECSADVKRPGKYEGEPIWVPYYQGQRENGFFEETLYVDGHVVDIFEVTDTDRKIFPELTKSHVAIYTNELGFVREATASIESMRAADGGED